MPYDPSDYTQCVAAYKMDTADVSGTSLTDDSGNGNTGTLYNSPTNVSGKINQGLSFNGTNQYINCNTLISFGHPDWVGTIAFWANGCSGSSVICNSRNVPVAEYDFAFIEVNGIVPNAFSYTNADDPSFPYQHTISSSTSFAGGAWNHFVLTSDGSGNYQMAVNGVITAISYSFNSLAYQGESVDKTYIGRNHDYTYADTYLTGSLDDVRFYDYPLSSTDIAALYTYTGSLIQGDPLFF